jgi:rhodanese-related sulfurtransferase
MANELKEKLDKGSVVLIDVREPAEHRSASIDGACLIPLSEISCDKLPSKEKPIVIHCASGKRSQEACGKLLEQDPTLDLYSLEGGLVAWEKSGFSVKRSGRNILPLDRQTQLTAGLLVFLGIILGTFVQHNFYWLSGFVGIGLMFAGLTGWCGMARLLAKMPWNR